MYGVIDFYKAAKAAGREAHHRLRGLCGAPGHVRPGPWDRQRVLPPGPAVQGYGGVCATCPLWCLRAFSDGFYGKPRVDLAAAASALRGASSPCPPAWRGPSPGRLTEDDFDAAKAYALELAEIFGPDNFYLELQDHGIAAQRTVNRELCRLARETRAAHGGHQRRPLSPPGGRQNSGRAPVRPDGQNRGRSQPDAV